MTGPSQSAETPETARPWEAHPPLPEEDADTGPIRVVALDDEVTREVPLPHLPQPDQGWPASYQPPPAETYASRFTAPLSVTPRPVSVRRTGIHPGVVAAGVAGVALVALAAWLLWPAGGEGGQDPVVAAPTTTVDAEAQDELLGFLPPGYPSNACTPADDPKEAAAVVDCKKNADTGGPTSATYSLFADADGLVGAFDDVVARLDVVNCPGNIQSPGPWRRNATPQRVAGTLVCGLDDGKPTVAWTTESTLVLNVARADPKGPALDQLYTWWSSHS